jgi:hypothetical protein
MENAEKVFQFAGVEVGVFERVGKAVFGNTLFGGYAQELRAGEGSPVQVHQGGPYVPPETQAECGIVDRQIPYAGQGGGGNEGHEFRKIRSPGQGLTFFLQGLGKFFRQFVGDSLLVGVLAVQAVPGGSGDAHRFVKGFGLHAGGAPGIGVDAAVFPAMILFVPFNGLLQIPGTNRFRCHNKFSYKKSAHEQAISRLFFFFYR